MKRACRLESELGVMTIPINKAVAKGIGASKW